MKTKRVLLVAAGAGGVLVVLHVARRVARLLSHREPLYSWLDSIIPPLTYDYKVDTASGQQLVATRYPQLQDVMDAGYLAVLTKPPDFDRPLPDELYILGTAHVSKKAAAAVYRTILAVEPDAVVVELDKSRASMMYRDVPLHMYEDPAEGSAVAKQEPGDQPGPATTAEPTGHPPDAAKGREGPDGSAEAASTQPGAAGSAAAATPSVSSAAQLQGLLLALRQGQSPLQALFNWVYMRMEAQLGTVAGLEFIRARHALEELEQRRMSGAEARGVLPPIARVYLGDAPLQRTLSRMWGVLSLGQKLRLVWMLARDCLSFEADEALIESLLQEDMLALLQKELGGEFPALLGPLLHERNWSLAHTVHQAAQHGMRRVVLVVGRGHVPGVIYCLLHPYRSRKARKAYSLESQGSGSQGLATPEAFERGNLGAGRSSDTGDPLSL